MSGPYAISSAKSLGTVRPKHRIKKVKEMRLSLKQRLRNWIMNDDDENNYVVQDVEAAHLESDGMRLQVYRASGGYVVETRSYDRRTDRNNNTMHVITDDQDLGQALGKIVMMEALRG